MRTTFRSHLFCLALRHVLKGPVEAGPVGLIWSFFGQGKQLIFQFVQKCMFTLFRLVEGATVNLNYVYILLISLCIKQRKRETLQSMNHS